eukprot:scaffold330081_cov91-Tisochrysis_lutea.AAC.1
MPICKPNQDEYSKHASPTPPVPACTKIPSRECRADPMNAVCTVLHVVGSNFRARRKQPRIRKCKRGQCGGRVAQHQGTGRDQVLNVGERAHDARRAVRARRAGVARIRAQDIEHVTEVEAHVRDLQPNHHGGLRRAVKVGLRNDSQVFQRAASVEMKPDRAVE